MGDFFTNIKNISLLIFFVVVFTSTSNYSRKNVGNVRFQFLKQTIFRQLKTEKPKILNVAGI